MEAKIELDNEIEMFLSEDEIAKMVYNMLDEQVNPDPNKYDIDGHIIEFSRNEITEKSEFIVEYTIQIKISEQDWIDCEERLKTGL